jgi:NADP-dependent 3-hydroxy acid dehydrogenase YdfG
LVAKLRARNLSARVVEQVDERAGAVVFLGLDAADDRAAIEMNHRAFLAAKVFASAATRDGGVFVTVQDTGGDFGARGDNALMGGLAGLAKTADLEWPLASVKAIDLERGDRDADAQAEAIVAELFEGGPECEVGLKRDGRRLTLTSELEPCVRGNGTPPLDETSVVVCSGGARGVTAATLIAVARKWRPRIVLVGRTALTSEPGECEAARTDAELKRALLQAAQKQGRAVKPAELGAEVAAILATREVRATIHALEAHGSKVRYVAADITDAPALTRALEATRAEWGPISAIVHGAGVIRDKHIQDKTAADVRAVLAPKVEGLLGLLAATKDDALRAIVLFSSVAGRTGNVGQSDYAIANEMLNKIAAREAARRPGCIVKALDWGPWEAGMVTPTLKSYFESQGVALIPLAIGAQMLIDELEADDGQSEVVLGAEPRHASIAGEHGPEQTSAVRVGASSHPYLVDHSIDGEPVLPVVMALEWLVRAAESLSPGKLVRAVRDLRVLRGVRLSGFADGGDWLLVRRSKTISEDVLELELCDPVDSRIRHYRATVELARALEPPPAGRGTLATTLHARPIYGDALFHGAAFQVIRRVVGVCDDGIVAEIVGTAESGWSATSGWRTDPALLDAGLQLCLLFAHHRLGGRGLPTEFTAFHRYTDELPTGELLCVVRGRTEGGSQTTCDIDIARPDGRLVARLLGVQIHQRP